MFVGTEPYLVLKRARKAADRMRYLRFKARTAAVERAEREARSVFGVTP